MLDIVHRLRTVGKCARITRRATGLAEFCRQVLRPNGWVMACAIESAVPIVPADYRWGSWWLRAPIVLSAPSVQSERIVRILRRQPTIQQAPRLLI